MWRFMGLGAKFLLLASLSLLMALPERALAAPSPLTLDESTRSFALWPHVSVLSDAGKDLNIQEVIAARNAFTAPTTAYGTLGQPKTAMWLHVPVAVSGEGGGTWILDIDYPVLNRIDVFIVRQQKSIFEHRLGSLHPPASPHARARSHAVSLEFQAGEIYDVYLRVESRGSLILPLTLSRPDAFMSAALKEQLLQGIFIGLALCLLTYSLAQWATLREHLFAKYALLVSGSLLFALMQFGIGSLYIWPGNLWLETHIAGLAALVAATGSFLFNEHALREPDTKPWFGRLMKTSALCTACFAVCFSFDLIDIYVVTAVISTLGLAPSVFSFPSALSKVRRGDIVGAYFLLAWVCYFVTTAVLIEVIKGRLGANFWTLHSFQLGATIDMLLFMRVLGLRTKALQNAAQRARNELDSLQSLAHTDPLTGLTNRRGLYTHMPAAIEKAQANNLCAVYMLDLDGFKQVNDQHGHDAGDELLIGVATRLCASVRKSDIVARLGGDEFVVLSSGLTSETQAKELGEKLIKSVQEPFALSVQPCQVSMTIGYALAPLDGNDALNLLKLADAAMYAGKNEGKNCIRRAVSPT